MATVLIKNGTVVTASDQYRADVLVDGETIALIGTKIDVAADTVLDEAGSVFGSVWELERRLAALAHEMTEQHDSPALPQIMEKYDRLRAEFDAAGGYRIEARIGEVLGGLGFDRR